jgi:Fur family ferric uptake transcriptional regulator
MEASDAALREGGHRLTPQRYMILHVIQEAQEHLSIEQILKLVQERNPCVSQATVYRTLDLLQTLGLVHATHLFGKHMCYEVVHGQAHHHFVCQSCHHVLHLDPYLLGNLPEQLKQQYGISGLTLELVATGYCKACWQIMQQEHGAATTHTAASRATH